jgi:aminomethyltransferase
MGEIEVRGKEALRLVNYVTTNDASRLKAGQAQYSGLLYEHGGFVDDILVHKVADDYYFLCVNASNQDKDYQHIVAHNTFSATVENAGSRYAQLAVQGPRALDTLQKLTTVPLASIRYYHFVDGAVSGARARIARTGYTGEDGFAVWAPGTRCAWRQAWLCTGMRFTLPSRRGRRTWVGSSKWRKAIS